MGSDDLAPRIRKLRAEIEALQDGRETVTLEDERPAALRLTRANLVGQMAMTETTADLAEPASQAAGTAQTLDNDDQRVSAARLRKQTYAARVQSSPMLEVDVNARESRPEVGWAWSKTRMQTMRRHSYHAAGIVLALGVLLSAPDASLGQVHQRTPAATTPHFAFHSDFATNLNDALITAGTARNDSEPELFHSGAEESCFGELPRSARAAWDRAVDYYAEIISPAEWSGRQQYLLRMHLAGFDEQLKDARARQFVEIARSFRAAAAPGYEACRWATQDAKNRRWIKELKSQLATHEQGIARRLKELYQKSWGALPIPVDVVETVSWSGASTFFPDSSSGHLLISNSYQGPAALEVVFHEASHMLMRRGDPLQHALAEAASALELPLPGDLWHVILFYTTGEAVRGILADAGESEYTPMVFAIFDRGSWGRYRAAIESTWPAYMDGKRALSEVGADLIQAIGQPGEPIDR